MISFIRGGLLLSVLCALPAQADIKEYVRDYNYRGADYDTEATCRVNAIDGVKRELLDELGTYVGSVIKINQDSLGNSYMSQDMVKITAGIVAMKVLNEKWNRPEYFVKASMRADPEDVLVKLKTMRADLELEKNLRESYEELQRARKEMAELKAQLEQLKRSGAAVVAVAVPVAVAPKAAEPVIKQLRQAEEQTQKKLASEVMESTKAPVPASVAPAAAVATSVPVHAEAEQAHKELSADALKEKSAAPAVTLVPATAAAPAPVPEAARLLASYQRAAQDVEVEEALQRALAARMKGDFGSLLKEMSALASKGYPKAQMRMGWIYDRGLGVPQNHVLSREWYDKAVANGEFEALASIGWLYEHGLGVTKDYAQAASYYQRAIDKDSAWGYTHMGYLYETGKGVNRNHEKAAEYYRIGMEKGNYLAMARLGFLYQMGYGVMRDLRKAATLYEEAVEHGQPVAMTRLGHMHNLGLGGVAKDHAKALALIRESVRYNLPVAYAFMGFMYENGWEVKQDYAEAKQWYEKAADLDAPFAEFRLGVMYKEGKGVTQDRQKAMYWLERAASKGEEKSADILSRMRKGQNW